MFWIKKRKPTDESGYLYLRETIYERDKRTHKRKPKKLGSGDSIKEKNKYTKKKDIYCGKISELEPIHLISFGEYIIKHKKIKDFIEYKINSAFEDLLYDFIDYLLYIHEIDRDLFFSKKKQVYLLGNGFLCKETIVYVKKFNVKGGFYNDRAELERFATRCQECSIFDDEIISALFVKLSSNKYKFKEEEIEDYNLEKQEYQDMMDFMKQQHN